MSSCKETPQSDDESIKSQSTVQRDENEDASMSKPHEIFVDYSDATESDLPLLQLQPNPNKAEPSADRRNPSNTKVNDQFPMKLYRMLSVVEDLGLAHIVSWKVHGRAFQVHNVRLFVSKVLPMFFRQSKITSFQRQLNLYGFQRFLHGEDTGASYHQFFLRGKPFLCQAMPRIKIKGASKRCKRKASERKNIEPDLYSIGEFLPQLSPEVRASMLKDFKLSALAETNKKEEDSANHNNQEDKKRMLEYSTYDQQYHEGSPLKQSRNWNQQMMTMMPPYQSTNPYFQPYGGADDVAPLTISSSTSTCTQSGSTSSISESPLQRHEQTPQSPNPNANFYEFNAIPENSYPLQFSSYPHPTQGHPQSQHEVLQPMHNNDFPDHANSTPKEVVCLGKDEDAMSNHRADIIPTSLRELKLIDSEGRGTPSLSIDDDLKSFFLKLMKSSDDGFVKLIKS